MKLLFLLCLCPFLAFGEEMKILTWNVFMIPKPISFSKQKERTILIAEEMLKTDHDIIFFQEAFSKGFRKQMTQKLKEKFPYQEHLRKSKRLLHFTNSGLYVMSVYPFKVLGWHYFNNCVHADCLSSKGVLLIEIELKSQKKVQFALSHMQAWNDKKAVAVRTKQIDEIKDFLDFHKKSDVIQILVGDLNIDGRIDTEYSIALKRLDMTSTPLEGETQITNGFKVSCYKTPGKSGEGQWLDHIWLRKANSLSGIFQKSVVQFKAILSPGQECPLSDHHAVEAILKI